MANFRRGTEAAQKAAERKSGGKFTPTIYWKDADETKYIQFLHSADDLITVLMHEYIITGHTDDGDPIYNSFVSRKDEGLDGPEGYDEIWDRFDIRPKQKTVAFAVELEPIMETVKKNGRNKSVISGFQVAKRTFTTQEGEEREVPAVGLIIQHPGNFYGWLTTFAEDEDIEDSVFRVTRKGKGADTRYDWFPVGDSLDDEELDLAEEDIIDPVAYLEDLASEDRMRDLIADLPDDATLSKFAQKGKGKSSKAESTSTSRSSSTRVRRPKARVDEEPEAEEPEEPESDDEGDDDPVSNRFERLRKKVGTKA